ncbi:MAG: lysophospholipase [Chloroflexota bacterium]|nr:lysophospholipase [Chloroflexota bacterium]
MTRDEQTEWQEGWLKGANGIDLYYRAWRPGSADPRAVIALAHGFGEHGGRYSNLVAQLVPHGYAVYALDHQGHGKSRGRRGHVGRWDEYREGLGALLRLVGEREPARPLFLMGHSLGGVIVLDYALRHPEGLRGLIASSPALGRVGVSTLLRLASRGLSRVWPELTLDTRLDIGTLSRDPEVLRACREDPLVHSLGTPRLSTELDRTVRWVQANARRLDVPFLMFHGTADRLAYPEERRVFFAHVGATDKTLLEYEGSYHETMNDLDHRRVLCDLEAWLEQHL